MAGNASALAWFNAVANSAIHNQEIYECDYRNPDDGLLYCGRCHTPREIRMEVFGEKKVLPVVCKCRKAEAEEVKRHEQEERNMELVAQLRKQSLMDARFYAQTFEAFNQTEQNQRILKLCKRYADKFDEMLERNQGLLLYGNVGTGKTFCAACISNALLAKRIPVIMTSFVKLLEDIRTFGEDGNDFMQRLNHAKLLVLDDLGAERKSDFALEKVYDIVDSRYRSSLPMILTTNLSLEEMKQTTDIRRARIYDRIFEVCYPVRFIGRSYREKEAERRFAEMRGFLGGDKE